MIRLDTTTRKLQVVLAGAVATTQLPVVCSWSDSTSTTYTGGGTPTSSNNTTAVDIVAAPGASTVRDVDNINIYNADTASVTVTVRLNDNATLYTLQKVTLLTGESLVYTHAGGWIALDVNGNRKEATSSVFSSLTVTGPITAVGPITETTGSAWTSYTPTILADTGTWGALTVTTARYRILGKTLYLHLQLSASVASGSPTQARILIPESHTAKASAYSLTQGNNNGSATTMWIREIPTYSAVVFELVTGAAFVGACAFNSGSFILELE